MDFLDEFQPVPQSADDVPSEPSLEGVDFSVATAGEISRQFGIPLEDIQTDANGTIVSIIDKDGEIIRTDVPSGEEGTASGSAAATSQPAVPSQAATPSSEKTSTSSTAPDAQVSLLSHLFDVLGHTEKTVETADGKLLTLAELTPDQQQETLDILIKQAQNPFQNETEERVITTLRSGKTLLEMAREIVKGDTQYLADSLSDKDVYSQYARKLDPKATAEEIEEEFNALPENIRTKRVAALREQMRKEDTTTAILTQMQADTDEQAKAQYTQDSSQIATYIDAQAELLGFSITKQTQQELKNYLIASSHKEEPEFLKAISTPEGLTRAAFLMKYFDSYTQNVQAYVEKAAAEVEALKKENTHLLTQLQESTRTRTITKPQESKSNPFQIPDDAERF